MNEYNPEYREEEGEEHEESPEPVFFLIQQNMKNKIVPIITAMGIVMKMYFGV